MNVNSQDILRVGIKQSSTLYGLCSTCELLEELLRDGTEEYENIIELRRRSGGADRELCERIANLKPRPPVSTIAEKPREAVKLFARETVKLFSKFGGQILFGNNRSEGRGERSSGTKERRGKKREEDKGYGLIDPRNNDCRVAALKLLRHVARLLSEVEKIRRLEEVRLGGGIQTPPRRDQQFSALTLKLTTLSLSLSLITSLVTACPPHSV